MRPATASTGVTAVAAVVAATCLVVPAPAGASTISTTITRSAHVAFENCNARRVILSVTIRRRAFTSTEPVTYTVRLSNTGSTTCGAPLASHVPQARRSLTVGPCGDLSAVVRNATGVDVYPGPLAYFCPDEVGLRLGPRSTTSTTGTWSQTEVLGSPPRTQHAAPGTYQLVVDGAVTVPVTLAPG